MHVRFDQPDASSDGGALLPQAVDERLGLSAALAAAMRDGLWSEYGDAIAAGYPDPDGDGEDLEERQIDLAFEDPIPF